MLIYKVQVAGERYSRIEALKIVRRIVKTGAIIPTAHLQDMMKERNFDMQDIVNCLNTGAILKEPELHLKTGKWIYTIEGKTIEGRLIKMPVQIDKEKNQLIVITGIK